MDLIRKPRAHTFLKAPAYGFWQNEPKDDLTLGPTLSTRCPHRTRSCRPRRAGRVALAERTQGTSIWRSASVSGRIDLTYFQPKISLLFE